MKIVHFVAFTTSNKTLFKSSCWSKGQHFFIESYRRTRCVQLFHPVLPILFRSDSWLETLILRSILMPEHKCFRPSPNASPWINGPTRSQGYLCKVMCSYLPMLCKVFKFDWGILLIAYETNSLKVYPFTQGNFRYKKMRFGKKWKQLLVLLNFLLDFFYLKLETSGWSRPHISCFTCCSRATSIEGVL